jgi:chorismate--pyruvate lyase
VDIRAKLLQTPYTVFPAPVWKERIRLSAIDAPAVWRPWLMDRGSLTQHLVKASHQQFSVQLLSLAWQYPSLSEAQALGIPLRHKALIREVILKGQNEAWVFARSVIPASTLTGRERQLHLIGQRSLGSVLFSDPTMRRGPLQTTSIQVDSHTLWARRSVFRLSNKPLLVAEVFLPALEQVHYSPSRY